MEDCPFLPKSHKRFSRPPFAGRSAREHLAECSEIHLTYIHCSRLAALNLKSCYLLFLLHATSSRKRHLLKGLVPEEDGTRHQVCSCLDRLFARLTARATKTAKRRGISDLPCSGRIRNVLVRRWHILSLAAGPGPNSYSVVRFAERKLPLARRTGFSPNSAASTLWLVPQRGQ